MALRAKAPLASSDARVTPIERKPEATRLLCAHETRENHGFAGCVLFMLYNVLKAVHVLAIILWLGGMAYTLFFLRPAVASLDAASRVKLMHDVLARFFKAVLWASTIAVASGLWMIGRVAKQTVQAGGSFVWPVEWVVMAALGIVMFLIFGHIRFALFKRLQRAVAASDWAAGGAALNTIRQWVAINLAIGVVIVAVTLIGVPK